MRHILKASGVKAGATLKNKMLRDGGGLYLRTRTGNGKGSWVIRGTKNGVISFDSIGRYPDMSLAEAREELEKYTCGGADGVTVAELFEAWYDHHETVWKRPHQMRGYIRRLSALAPHLMAMNIKAVELQMVSKVLLKYSRKHGKVAANRLTNICKQVFDRAEQLGWLKHSPLNKLTSESIGGKETTRARVLTDDEIVLVWNLNRHTDLFRFMLLTGQRISETQQAQFEHFTDGEWFIPAANNKSARDHTVSLSRQAQEIVARQDTDPLFGVTSPTAVQAYLKRWCTKHKVGENNTKQIHLGAFTPHDLRRTMCTRMNKLGVGPHIVEKLLNHSMQGVMAIYNRADYMPERVAAMQLWADEIDNLLRSSHQLKLVINN